MDPILGVLFVVWVIKVLAEDSYSTVKGKPNPRLDRRRARQKSRAGNPIWSQLVGWAGDVAEDARAERGRARKAKRARQEKARRDAEAIEAEVVDDIQDAEIIDDPAPAEKEEPKQRRRHDELTADECEYDFCPYHGKPRAKQTEQSKPEPGQQDQAGDNPKGTPDMNDEIIGLDGAIATCEALIASMGEHGPAGTSGEQYLNLLEAHNVTGPTLQSAHDMQQSIAVAVGAIEAHKVDLEEQKPLQEAYDMNPDAGDQAFQQAGR